jgi:hypothetical protein
LFVPLLLIVRLATTTVGAHHGAVRLAILRRRWNFIVIIMSVGGEIHFGALNFIADGSAWLQEAPLDVESLPIRGAAHFRAASYGVLLRQPSVPYRVAPVLPAGRRRKRSGRSWLQRWVKHAMAVQAVAEHVVSLEPDEPALDIFAELHEDSSGESE